VKLFRTFLTQHPLESKRDHPALLEDLLETALSGKQDCVDKAIAMIEDLQFHGTNCRFIKPLAGAIMELKSRTDDGGARVYFFRVAEDAFALGRFECKKEDAASRQLVNWTAQVAMFYAKGQTEVII
jgi:hypothetical protein